MSCLIGKKIDTNEQQKIHAEGFVDMLVFGSCELSMAKWALNAISSR